MMSKDLLVRDTYSADHFEKEVKCTMTDLSDIIQLCGDTIFKVSFKKKVDNNDVKEQLKKLNPKDKKGIKLLSKCITEGK